MNAEERAVAGRRLRGEVRRRQQAPAHARERPVCELRSRPGGRATAQVARHEQRARATLDRALAVLEPAPEAAGVAVRPLLERQLADRVRAAPAAFRAAAAVEHEPTAPAHAADPERVGRHGREVHAHGGAVGVPAHPLGRIRLLEHATRPAARVHGVVERPFRSPCGQPSSEAHARAGIRVRASPPISQPRAIGAASRAGCPRRRRGQRVEQQLATPVHRPCPRPSRPNRRAWKRPCHSLEPHPVQRALAGDIERTIVEHLREPAPADAPDDHVHVAIGLAARQPPSALARSAVRGRRAAHLTSFAVRAQVRGHPGERRAPRARGPP